MRRFLILCGILLVVVGCVKNEGTIVLPEDIPDFVQLSDVETINWHNKAVEFGDRGIIGNENKSGVIGGGLTTYKWMWHLWGIENIRDTKLTIVGFHKESSTVQPILVDGWTIGLGGPNNGADAHTPSGVIIPEPGEWAILLYVNEKLFDTLVYEINE
ncbi:hypothetical protein ACQKII_08395 [Lysinibacillus sp. NPDC048646]|uniref:hypothetical protein n=1 Tax=Lysinibacillus sp. NPDC048646 TaxID=3390574 RepID=UPI003D01E13E